MIRIGQKHRISRLRLVLTENSPNVSLSSYAGKWLVIMFYPGDFTFVCATEVSAAAENQEAFETLKVDVLTISVLSPIKIRHGCNRNWRR